MVETKLIRVITLTVPSVVIADEDWESIRDSNERLKKALQELSLAEEGMANYAQKIATLRNDLTACQLERDWLRKGLQRAYSIWSHAQEDSSIADRIADVINEVLKHLPQEAGQ